MTIIEARPTGRQDLARAVMVLGTTSGAGKSLITTALCRWYQRQGLAVAPFKAQNMSNNARVVDGGEIGTAQYCQALAARVRPEVAMNPLLLKPERDTRSQVVLDGRFDAELSALPWRERSRRVWPRVRQTLQALRARHEVLVIEGAGSPAEINLADSDFVNGRTASAADARCLLVADIDRGGAFAHLYGTHRLVDDETRSRIDGFVLNRFRGDPALLAPGPAMLEQLTGVPTLGWLPYWPDHGLPEEDGPLGARFDRFEGAGGNGNVEGNGDLEGAGDAGDIDGPGATAPGPRALRIGIVAWPRISNLDEFGPLRRLPGVETGWLRDPAMVARADWLILPGSKHTSGDLAWLRRRGLDDAIRAHVAAGKPLLAICGGLQMLGASLVDPHGVDGSDQGLGILPLATRFAATKTVHATRARFAEAMPAAGSGNSGNSGSSSSSGGPGNPWQALAGLVVDGYEIHHGDTATIAPGPAACRPALHRPGTGAGAGPAVIGWQQGAVLAIYLHGLFENAAVMNALFRTPGPSLDEAFDRLADGIDRHLPRAALMALIGR